MCKMLCIAKDPILGKLIQQQSYMYKKECPWKEIGNVCHQLFATDEVAEPWCLSSEISGIRESV